ncbi:fimbrial protein [Serratia ficaria]|uniref:fimbrial protein n=1 Tax=Serratia ficaria TaxID=61651 RepID=UPI00217BA977|nr:fimbrial protein [Serratia ficaria]CAI1508201.1 Minor fimbrial protein prsF precursor [Serratia ficaria]
MKKYAIPRIALLIGITLLTGPGVMPAAQATPGEAAMNFKGTLVVPSCVVNDNKTIDVDFGDVLTTRVDGTNYRKQLSYTLTCESGVSKALKLQVQGTAAAFNGELLNTSVTGLGIRLRNGGSNLPVNSWLNFTYPNKPTLWVVPVQKSGVTLAGGQFSATATLKVAYQ